MSQICIEYSRREFRPETLAHLVGGRRNERSMELLPSRALQGVGT